MIDKFVLRSQLQVDAGLNLKREIKRIAAEEGTSMREVVLMALADKYAQLKPYIRDELNKFGQSQK